MKLVETLRARARAFGPGGLVNLAAAAGGAIVCHGVARIYAPAGEILAGALLIAGAWLAARILA